MGVAADTAERKIVGRNKIDNISLTTVVRGKVAACSIGGAVLNGEIWTRRKGKASVREMVFHFDIAKKDLLLIISLECVWLGVKTLSPDME